MTSKWIILFLFTLTLNVVNLKSVNNKEEINRKKRSYPWSSGNSISVFNAGRTYTPAPYTISRPYFIPVYRLPGGNLMFYPPQPLYMNPGVPQDNPHKPPYQAPTYLPPYPPKETTTMSTSNRFGEDDDDAPIWGDGGIVQMPLSSDKEWTNIPTRPPGAARLPPRPSLIHNDERRTTTVLPPASTPTPGPSNCVWAIISCCSAADESVLPQRCFEQRGCPGPFWGDSPCQSDFARAAIQVAMNYYNRNPGAVMQ